jgi:glutamine amidotransferase
MYFVHSYVAVPADPRDVLARSNYGGIEFCSAVSAGLVSGFQFHPERSGPGGLRIYRNLAAMLNEPR